MQAHTWMHDYVGLSFLSCIDSFFFFMLSGNLNRRRGRYTIWEWWEQWVNPRWLIYHLLLYFGTIFLPLMGAMNAMCYLSLFILFITFLVNVYECIWLDIDLLRFMCNIHVTSTYHSYKLLIIINFLIWPSCVYNMLIWRVTSRFRTKTRYEMSYELTTINSAFLSWIFVL